MPLNALREAVSGALAITPETLWRFRFELGLDPATYREQRLLETAYRVLTGSDLRVAAVAAGRGSRAG